MGKESKRLKRCSTSTDVEAADPKGTKPLQKAEIAERELQNSETDVNPKKRKKKSQSKQIDEDTYEKKMEKMKKMFEQIREKINELNKELLTIADIDSFSTLNSNWDAAEVLLSWRFKRPDLISAHAIQMKDDCWAYAFARGLSALMKQHGNTENLPTAELLVAQIDRKCLTKTNALLKSIDAAPSLLCDYGCELVVHHRPKLNNEAFEKFIERRLAIGPMAMRFPYVPGYSCFSHKDKAIFRPSITDIQAMHYESLDNHYAVITGRGVVLSGVEFIEFWEIHDTRGYCFGDKGFTRLERHMGLITEVYEFSFAHREDIILEGS